MSDRHLQPVVTGAPLGGDEAAIDTADVRQAQSGDLRAFERLVRRYEHRIFSFLVRWLGDRGLAEDVLQEATIDAFQKLDRFHCGKAFRPWFFKIAVNRAKTVVRTLSRAKQRCSDWLEMQATLPTSPVTGPLRALGTLELGLAALSASDRQVLLLRFGEELTLEEMSDVLGISRLVLRVRVHRARDRFRTAVRTAEAEEVGS